MKFPLALLNVLVKLLQAEFGEREKTTTPSIPQCPTTTHERQAAAGRGDRRAAWREATGRRQRALSPTSMGVFTAAEEQNWRREIRSKWLKTRKWSASPKSWIKWCTRRTRWVPETAAASAEKHAIRWWALPLTAERRKILEACLNWPPRSVQDDSRTQRAAASAPRAFWK